MERRLPHPNALTIQLPPVCIGLRTTGLTCSIKDYVTHVVSARLANGIHSVTKAEIAQAIRQVGGLVSRSGLKLALSELSEGTTRVPPRILRVSAGRYAMCSDETQAALLIARLSRRCERRSARACQNFARSNAPGF